MDFNSYLSTTLETNSELCKEYTVLESDYNLEKENNENQIKAEYMFKSLGIDISTEYGNYFPLYIILRKIGKLISDEKLVIINKQEFTKEELLLLKMAFTLVHDVLELQRVDNYDVDMLNVLYSLKEKLGIINLLEK